MPAIGTTNEDEAARLSSVLAPLADPQELQRALQIDTSELRSKHCDAE